MLVFAKIKSVQQKIKSLKKGTSIGFVPTMGALHKGHLSLIKQAKRENDIVVVSIFVNPTQFDKQEDLANYPKTIDTDLSLLKSVCCDIVFTPTAEEMYNNSIQSQSFDFDGLEHQMEGKFRDGHFDGVGTIVKRLFEIVTPHKAYFGEKDFQQLQVIKTMARDLSMPVEIIGVPTMREVSGLAMSSRNGYLSAEQKTTATALFKALGQCAEQLKQGNKDFTSLKAHAKQSLEQAGLKPDYIEIRDSSDFGKVTDKSLQAVILVAAFVGKARLIDNLTVELS